MKVLWLLVLSVFSLNAMQVPTFLHKTVSWEYEPEQLKTYISCFPGNINTYCNGCTPLHEWAVWSLGITPSFSHLYNAQEKLALLIKAGADTSLTDKHGHTALDILQINYKSYSKHPEYDKGSYAITVLMAQLQFAHRLKKQ